MPYSFSPGQMYSQQNVIPNIRDFLQGYFRQKPQEEIQPLPAQAEMPQNWRQTSPVEQNAKMNMNAVKPADQINPPSVPKVQTAQADRPKAFLPSLSTNTTTSGTGKTQENTQMPKTDSKTAADLVLGLQKIAGCKKKGKKKAVPEQLKNAEAYFCGYFSMEKTAATISQEDADYVIPKTGLVGGAAGGAYGLIREGGGLNDAADWLEKMDNTYGRNRARINAAKLLEMDYARAADLKRYEKFLEAGDSVKNLYHLIPKMLPKMAGPGMYGAAAGAGLGAFGLLMTAIAKGLKQKVDKGR